ncbi:MAG: hypothetical protein VB140_02370 [Burkholderia sp.]
MRVNVNGSRSIYAKTPKKISKDIRKTCEPKARFRVALLHKSSARTQRHRRAY